MKRKGNLYEQMCDYKNICTVFNEVCKNTKNKNKVNKFRTYKCINIFKIYSTLKNREYKVGPYNIFTIYEPKQRRIVSQNMFDKVVNHLVSRYVLIPAVSPSLIDTNVASRTGKGTVGGLKYYYDYRKRCDQKYKKYYILKFDIKKYFASIDHEILKEKIKRKIKDKDALKIVFDIIDSEEKGLGIGNMTSQVLAIFYLNDLDHYIKEELKIKYYVRYQDDAVLFHQSKKYLQECLKKIEAFLVKEKLSLNKKTRIYSNNCNFIFLGRNKYGEYGKYRKIHRKYKKRIYLYKNKKIKLYQLMSSINNFRALQKRFG